MRGSCFPAVSGARLFCCIGVYISVLRISGSSAFLDTNHLCHRPQAQVTRNSFFSSKRCEAARASGTRKLILAAGAAPFDEINYDEVGLDPYATLGVSPTATIADIKAAFRDIAMNTHPDKHNSPDKLAKFKEAKWAYKLLLDPEQRARHDQRRTVSQMFELAREVGGIAVPLINLTVQSIDRQLIRGIAIPFLTDTAEQTSTAVQAAMQAHEQGWKAGLDPFEIAAEAAQAAKVARDRTKMQQQLRGITQQSETVIQALLKAMEELQSAHDEEMVYDVQVADGKNELQIAEEQVANFKAQEEELHLALSHARAQEQAERDQLNSQMGMVQVILAEKSGAAFSLQKSMSELEEAERAFAQAQTRLFRAREAVETASQGLTAVESRLRQQEEVLADVTKTVNNCSVVVQDTSTIMASFTESWRQAEASLRNAKRRVEEAVEARARKASYRAFLTTRVTKLRAKVVDLQKNFNQIEMAATVLAKEVGNSGNALTVESQKSVSISNVENGPHASIPEDRPSHGG